MTGANRERSRTMLCATWIIGDPNNPLAYEIKHGELTGIGFGIAAHARTGAQRDPLAAK